MKRKPTLKSAKKRACAECAKQFIPRRPLQRTCSPSCALAYSRERAAKKERRESRAWTRVQREAMKTKPQLTKEAQSVFNAFIRLRDAGLPCISCGRSPNDNDLITGSRWDCGHYRSVGSAPELRFNEDNAARQCVHCNQHRSGNGVEYRIGLIARIGIERVEALEGPHQMPKWTHDELRTIREKYRAKATAQRALIKEARAAGHVGYLKVAVFG